MEEKNEAVENLNNSECDCSKTSEWTMANKGKSNFDGWLIQKIGWDILCAFLTVITLGIAYPAAVCLKKKWYVKHTVYDGKRLSFDGRGIQLFGIWMLNIVMPIAIVLAFFGSIFAFFGTVSAMGGGQAAVDDAIALFMPLFIEAVAIVALILYIIVPVKIKAWYAKHTHIEGVQPAEGTFKARKFRYFLLKVGCALLNVITLFIMVPFTTCWVYRFEMKHTVYDGKNLYFDGKGIQLLGRWILWMLLTLITAGIYGLFVALRFEKWKAWHTHIVETPVPEAKEGLENASAQ